MNAELTKGQKLVGLNFNPSGDDQVTKFKQACANAIDILIEERIVSLVIDSILTGQKFGVKAQTWTRDKQNHRGY